MGTTLAMLLDYLKTVPHAFELGLFIDWASLPQKPRTPQEEGAFRKTLGVMLSLYASVTGTAVLQCKEIPPRPPRFNGCLVLFDGLREGEDMATLRGTLIELVRAWGDGETRYEMVGCTVEEMKIVPMLRVRFHEHAHAECALAALDSQGRAAALEYNDRAYDGVGGRGWCIAEQGAAKAVAAHLKAAASGDGGVPERFRLAEVSRPKVVELGDGGAAREPDLRAVPERELLERRRHGTTPSEHLDQALKDIERANFTGKGDKPKVQMLLAKLEWLIRGAVEEDAISLAVGEDNRTIDPAIVRRQRRARPHPDPIDDGIVLLEHRHGPVGDAAHLAAV